MRGAGGCSGVPDCGLCLLLRGVWLRERSGDVGWGGGGEGVGVGWKMRRKRC